MSEPLRVDHVSKTFAAVRAVDDVSFATRAGEMFFLLGPSGCGKTTLLRAVAGLAEIDSGEIYLGERRITTAPPHRRNTAMVFQNYALWPHMTVLENVTFGLRLRRVGRRERDRRGREALGVVHMGDLADRRPNQLSGGQQQRVALARALAVEPDCLLLDEPLSNLDAKLRLEMREEIRRIHRETGLTVLYVTHDQKEALSLADRVALMRGGRIEQVGAPRELYHRPASRFAAGFLGETNFLAGRLAGVEGDTARVETAAGMLSARVPEAKLDAGSACVVSVRPEALAIEPAAEGETAGKIPARIADVTFLGELEQVMVEAEGLGRLKVLEVPRSDHRPEPGRAVLLAFDAQAASVFAAGDDADDTEHDAPPIRAAKEESR